MRQPQELADHHEQRAGAQQERLGRPAGRRLWSLARDAREVPDHPGSREGQGCHRDHGEDHLHGVPGADDVVDLVGADADHQQQRHCTQPVEDATRRDQSAREGSAARGHDQSDHDRGQDDDRGEDQLEG